MKNIHEECEGCRQCLSHDTICMIRYEKELRQTCPCKICIIKTMCEKICHQRCILYGDLSIERKIHLSDLHKVEIDYEKLK